MLMALSLTVYASTVTAAEELTEEQLVLRQTHQDLLNATRSGNIDMLNDFLTPTDGNPAKHTPTTYDARELFNAVFINKQWPVMACFWAIPGFSDPVDYLYLDMEIDYPQTTVPYPKPKGLDDPNDIFSYNICSRTAFCHIYTPIPNTNDSENSRWLPIFEFFKAAERAKQGKLIQLVVQKAYLYNKEHRPTALQQWINFIQKKEKDEGLPELLKSINLDDYH